MLKILNTEKTLASFDGASFSLSGPEEWNSIGDTYTRDCVIAWLAEGNVPEPADPVPNPRIAEVKAELDALDFKKIRPIAAGDAEYLSILQAQTVVLRDELKLLLYPVVSQSQEPDQQNGPTE